MADLFIDYEVLAETSTRLAFVADKFVSAGADAVAIADAAAGHEVLQTAILRSAADWQFKREKLVNNMGQAAASATDIAKSFEETDNG